MAIKMMVVWPVAVAFALAVSSHAAELSGPKLQAYVAQSMSERPGAIEREQIRLKRLKGAPKPKSKASAERHRDLIKATQDLISDLQDPLKPYFGRVFLYDASKGGIGWSDETLKVFQVIDANNVIAEYEGSQALYYYMANTAKSRDFDDKLFWLVMPTAGITDGQKIAINRVFMVTGTKTYNTIAGSKTVTMLEFPDVPEVEFIAKSEPREWTLEDGTKTQLSLVKSSGGKVTLIDGDGKPTVLKQSAMSKADAEFISDYIKSQRKK